MRHQLLLLSLAAVSFAGCHRLLGRVVEGNGDVKTEARPLTGAFTSIENRAFVNVEASLGAPASVKVTCDSNLLPHLRTRMDAAANELVIDSDDPGLTLRPTFTCVVQVVTPTLVRFANAGAGRATISGPIHQAGLELDLSGAGAIDARDLDVEAVVTRLTGAGAVDAYGRAKKAKLVLTGTGKVDASLLKVEDATVELSGAGEVRVFATHSFGGHVSGVGHVEVAGNPTVRDAQVSGVGGVTYE